MSVVTCPGPGGPVTFSPPTYVIRHVHGGQLWTAAQRNIPVVFVVARNSEYAALKEFTRFMHAPDAPGIERPDMDIPGIAAPEIQSDRTGIATRTRLSTGIVTAR